MLVCYKSWALSIMKLMIIFEYSILKISKLNYLYMLVTGCRRVKIVPRRNPSRKVRHDNPPQRRMQTRSMSISSEDQFMEEIRDEKEFQRYVYRTQWVFYVVRGYGLCASTSSTFTSSVMSSDLLLCLLWALTLVHRQRVWDSGVAYYLFQRVNECSCVCVCLICLLWNVCEKQMSLMEMDITITDRLPACKFITGHTRITYPRGVARNVKNIVWPIIGKRTGHSVLS